MSGLNCLGAEEKKDLDYKEVLLKEGPGIVSKIIDVASGKPATPAAPPPSSMATQTWATPVAVAGGVGVLGLLGYLVLRRR
jgi:hypothetical protein